MIGHKNDTEDLKLSMTKNCETFIHQTHRKPQAVLEFKLDKSREAFYFNPPTQIEGSWMIGLISLELYISSFIQQKK